MAELKNILVPTDFSQISKNALRYAVELATNSNAKLFLLHAYRLIQQDKTPKADARELKRGLEQSVEERFEEIFTSMLDEGSYDVSCVKHVGFTEDSIESFIRSEPVDLIIMGTLGESARRRTFGSTLSAVVKTTSVPVLAIPQNVSFRNWEHILITENICNKQIDRSFIVPYLMSKFQPESKVVDMKCALSEHIIAQYEEALIEPNLFAIDTNEYEMIEQKLNQPIKKELSAPLLIA